MSFKFNSKIIIFLYRDSDIVNFGSMAFEDPTRGPRNIYTYLEDFIIMDDDVIKLKHFLSSWPFMREILQLPADSPHKGQWHKAITLIMMLM